MDIVWIIKHKDDITKWYMKKKDIFDSLENTRGLRKDDLLWYESHVAKYVAEHAFKFSKRELKNVLIGFQLGDKRTDSRTKKALIPDLILQFDRELWVVEVKYHDSYPNPETKYGICWIDQLESYCIQLEYLIKEGGWFVGVEHVHLALFCAYKNKKEPMSDQMREARKWPIKR